MQTNEQSGEMSHETHEIVVNDRSVRIINAEPTGSQILAGAGFEPVDDYVLIEKAKVGSRVISLDERVSLAGRIAQFFAFHTGEMFSFTVNEHSFQWGRKIITEAEIRELADVPQDDVLVLGRRDGEPRVLAAGDEVDLGKPGTEHLRTEKRLVEVFIDNLPKEIPRGVYTTEELIVVLEVKPGYLLNLAGPNGLVTLKPHQRIYVKQGMRFFSQVPGGGSSR